MSGHIRYAVRGEDGYARRKGSSHHVMEPFEKCDLYLTEHRAKQSAKRQGGRVVKVYVEEMEKEQEYVVEPLSLFEYDDMWP